MFPARESDGLGQGTVEEVEGNLILVTHYSRTTVVDGLYGWREDENRAVCKALGPTPMKDSAGQFVLT